MDPLDLAQKGFRRNGPYTLVCLVCGGTLGLSGMTRGGHRRGRRHQLAEAELRARWAQERRDEQAEMALREGFRDDLGYQGG